MALKVTEIFTSIQGESSWAGLPCTFIRLTGCPLRCRWCDTVYSFKGGKDYELDELIALATARRVNLVEVTGGEPLSQPETPELIRRLLEHGFEVLIETSGSEPIDILPPQTHVIMDIKCPDSGMAERNLWSNIDHLKAGDEVKFVIASQGDFTWACQVIEDYRLHERTTLLMSPAWGLVQPKDLAAWVLEKNLPCRLNLQLHKYIWGPRTKGV